MNIQQINNIIAKYFEKVREQNGISKQGLSKGEVFNSKINRQVIARFENGKKPLTLEYMLLMADRFNLKLSELFLTIESKVLNQDDNNSSNDSSNDSSN